MTTTKCDLCGVECSGKYLVIRLESYWIRPDISFNPKPLRRFEFCPDCSEKMETNQDRIRLVIEPEQKLDSGTMYNKPINPEMYKTIYDGKQQP